MKDDGSRGSEVYRLAKLVGLMRASQRRYSDGDRSPESLRHARDLERRVDAALAWVLERRSPYRQGRLAVGARAGDARGGPGASSGPGEAAADAGP